MPDVKVELYGADWCVHCRNAKRWMDDNDVEYEFKDVDKSVNQNFLKGLNAQGIPFIQVKKEGKEAIHLHGFAPERLKAAIQ